MIALVDCNSFYCNCERLFRPDLLGRPIVVLSNNDGCVISASKEAKKFGLKIGVPLFELKDLMKNHDLQVFSANFALYTDISTRVMNTLERHTYKIQKYSIDEAFLAFEGPALKPRARELKDSVEREVGVPVGVGVAPTKVLAKVANHRAKKIECYEGVCVLENATQIECALKEMPIEDVWGIGRQSALKMKDFKIKTAYDFATYKNERQILKTFTKVGLAIKHELMGIRALDLEVERIRKKEISCSRSFGGDVHTLEELREAITTFATLACQKLRAQDSMVKTVSVFIRTNPFKNSPQYTGYDTLNLDVATLDSFKVIKACHELLERIYRPGLGYKKAGVALNNLCNQDEVQLDLLCPGAVDSIDRVKLMHVIDAINARHGPLTVKSAGCSLTPKATWKMLQQRLSPAYLSSWHQLPKVAC